MSTESQPPPVEAPRIKKRRGTGARNANAADSAAEIARVERRERCIRLRASGLTFAAIAKTMGYLDKGQAHKDFRRALADRPAEAIEELRAIDNAATDQIIHSHLKNARAGDTKAADVVLKALAHKAKINGYMAPEKHEHTGRDGGPIAMTSDARDELFARLTRLADGETQSGAAPQGTGGPH